MGCSRLARCVHSSVNKPGANARVCYNTLTHSRPYCRDRESRSWIKDCFYAFYKLGNAPKSVSAGALPRTPLRKLTALPQTPSWWGGGSPRPPQEPHPLLGPSGFGHTGYMLCRPPTPPKINPSYGLDHQVS